MKKLNNILLISILILFVFLRFWNIENRIGFDWDQERDAMVAYDMIVKHKPTLIGPRVVGPEGFFLGPYFNYIITPFYLIGNLNPVVSIILFLIFINLLFFYLVWKLLPQVYERYVVIILLLFWSINPYLITFETSPWNPIMISVGVIWLIYILKKIYEDNETRDWILLGLNLGIFFHFHFQYIFIMLFSVVFILISRIKLKLKNIVYTKLCFLVTFLPLLFFDLRHDFLNSKKFIEFFFVNKSNAEFSINHWQEVFANFVQSIVGINSLPITYFFYFAFLIVLIYLGTVKKKFEGTFFKSIAVLWIIFPVLFSLYSRRPSEYYFVFLYPLIFITITSLFKNLKSQLILLFLIAISVFLNYPWIKGEMRDRYLGLKYKSMAIARIKALAENKEVRVNFNTDPGRNVGFNYLLIYHKINAQDKDGLSSFEITVPPKDYQEIFGGVGLQIPKL
jgi:hypothetical protein